MTATQERADAVAPFDDLPRELLLRMYQKMWQARRVSTRALQLHRAGVIHLAVPCDGHEAAQVGSALALPAGRTITFPYYRSWATVQALGMTPLDIFLAVFAREDDPSSHGRQMPGHFCRPDLRIVTTSSVVGSQIPHAVGAALAARQRGANEIAATWFGDGGTSQGDFHEGLNWASIHKLPVIFICENNQYAISVPLSKQSAVADLAKRAIAYGMPGVTVDGNDVVAVYRATREAVERAERGEGPTLIECKTYRTAPHTSDDDDRGYRPREEVELWRTQRDPLQRFERALLERGVVDEAELQALQERIAAEIEAAITAAEQAAPPKAEDILLHVWAPGTAPLGS